MEMGDEDMTVRVVDDVLLKILSFISTKDALRTSVLSKRWRYLWKSLSIIDLDDSIPVLSPNIPPNYPHCRIFFLHLVDRLLHGHDDSDITRFRIYCDVPVDVARFTSWISAAIDHNAKEIALRFPLRRSCSLPSCLFSSRSLTTLSISVRYGVLGFPSSLSSSCPCLKTLNLSRVKFIDNHATKKLFFQLSSIFPILQKLSLIQCKWENVKGLVIRSSTLEEFALDTIIFGDNLLDCELVISAPRLSCFDCKTDSTVDIRLGDPIILADASLEFIFPAEEDQEVVYERLTRLLIAMENSNHLTLSPETLSGIYFSEHVPVLQNLTNLDITGVLLGSTVEDTMDFMHKTPNLEYLAFYLENEDDDDYMDNYMEYWRSDDHVTGCPLHKLKILRVEGLDAAGIELRMIKIFLENAPNLEKVEVNAHKSNTENLERVRNEIEELPRSSENCAFLFEVKNDD